MSLQNAFPLFRTLRIRFTLRACFGLIALVACWLGYHLHWIEQRHQFLREQSRRYSSADAARDSWGPGSFQCRAPGALPLFDEKGIAVLSIAIRGDYQQQMSRAQRLFPEATVLPAFLCGTAEMSRKR